MLEYLATMETADDRTRFESLYLAYRGLMYHVAYHILKNPPRRRGRGAPVLCEAGGAHGDYPRRPLSPDAESGGDGGGAEGHRSISLPPAPSGDGAG